MTDAEFLDHLFKLALAHKGAIIEEIGWLCEQPDQALGPSWWCAPEHEWTKDSRKALRFARKEDAENYIAEVGWDWIIATEHIWHTGSATP